MSLSLLFWLDILENNVVWINENRKIFFSLFVHNTESVNIDKKINYDTLEIFKTNNIYITKQNQLMNYAFSDVYLIISN